jgi:hypothetical protein
MHFYPVGRDQANHQFFLGPSRQKKASKNDATNRNRPKLPSRSGPKAFGDRSDRAGPPDRDGRNSAAPGRSQHGAAGGCSGHWEFGHRDLL